MAFLIDGMACPSYGYLAECVSLGVAQRCRPEVRRSDPRLLHIGHARLRPPSADGAGLKTAAPDGYQSGTLGIAEPVEEIGARCPRSWRRPRSRPVMPVRAPFGRPEGGPPGRRGKR